MLIGSPSGNNKNNNSESEIEDEDEDEDDSYNNARKKKSKWKTPNVNQKKLNSKKTNLSSKVSTIPDVYLCPQHILRMHDMV